MVVAVPKASYAVKLKLDLTRHLLLVVFLLPPFSHSFHPTFPLLLPPTPCLAVQDDFVFCHRLLHLLCLEEGGEKSLFVGGDDNKQGGGGGGGKAASRIFGLPPALPQSHYSRY